MKDICWIEDWIETTERASRRLPNGVSDAVICDRDPMGEPFAGAWLQHGTAWKAGSVVARSLTLT
jgi:hypothetical protein